VCELVTYRDVDFTHLEIQTPGFHSGSTRLGPSQFLLTSGNHKPHVQVSSDFLRLGSELETDSISLSLQPENDSLRLTFEGAIADSIPIHLNGDFKVYQHPNNTLDFAPQRFTFNLGTYHFAMEKDGLISWDTRERWDFKQLAINQENFGSLLANGSIGPSVNDTLRVKSNELQISFLNNLVRDARFQLSGELNGAVQISQVYQRPVFSGDFGVDNLVLNRDTLGNLGVQLALSDDGSKVLSEARLVKGTRAVLKTNGMVGLQAPYALTFETELDRFKIKPFEKMLEGTLDRFRGQVSGKLLLNGTSDRPQLTGSLQLRRVGFRVPYLGVDYAVDGTPEIEFTPNRIEWPAFAIQETSSSTKGTISGVIRHQFLSKWDLDIQANGNGLMALNLEEGPEVILFGKAYTDGQVRIHGPVERLKITANATSAPGTDVYINVDNPTEINESGFIEFAVPGTVLLAEQSRNSLPTGVEFELNLQLKPNATGHLVLDQNSEDAISGRGDGNLRILMARDGALSMFGTIIFEDGEYLFTLRNLTRKILKIERGGSISWSGDPYAANLNLNALYSVKTNVSPPLDPGQYAGLRSIAQVVVMLSGELTNPNIGFQVRLPEETPNVQSALANKLFDQDKINQQAFSLLIFNSFTAEDGAEQNYLDRGLSNTYNVVASQLANYINQGNQNFDVTLNYNTAATGAGGEQNSEVEVGLSKQFFDDRLSVNGSVGVPVNGNQTNQLVGDVEAEYKITKDGRWKAKAFNRSNQFGSTSSLAQQNAYTQGVGVQFSTDFENWKEFLDKLFRRNPEGTAP
jgi:hypothetical protein